jgi:AcrR family transcriptional regulator
MSMEKRRAQRRTQLIAAAKQAFGEYGYQATTVKQICREAELTERYFYESFENLNALFGVTYDQELDRLRETLTLAIASSTTDVEAMARSGMQAYYGFLKQDPHAARILLIEIYGTTHDMIRLYRRGVQDFAGLIRGIIELQYPQAQPLVLDPGLLATALVGAAIQLAMRWYLGGYEESEESMVDNTVAIITALSDKLTQTPA